MYTAGKSPKKVFLTRFLRFGKIFIPDIFFWLMVVAVGLAFTFPQIAHPDGIIPISAITKFGVLLIFFIYGATISPSTLQAGLRNWRVHVMTQSVTFILFPLVGLFLYFFAKMLLTPPLEFGFFFLAVLPSTISSSVALTRIACGNVSAAVFNATLSGLIGLFITPILIAMVISVEERNFPILQSIMQIILLLLAPFAAGQCLQRWLKPLLDRYTKFTHGIDRGVILLIIFSSFSASVNDGVWEQFSIHELIITGLMVAFALAIVLVITISAARIAQLPRQDKIVVVFCGATKSLVNGVPISQIIFAGMPGLGLVLLPVLLFHQLQLVVFGIMARHYAKLPHEHSPPIVDHDSVPQKNSKMDNL